MLSLQVQEGGESYLSTKEISAYDPDTDLSKLVFTVETEPRYGRLFNRDMPLVESEQFMMKDLTDANIRYVSMIIYTQNWSKKPPGNHQANHF